MRVRRLQLAEPRDASAFGHELTERGVSFDRLPGGVVRVYGDEGIDDILERHEHEVLYDEEVV